MVLENLFARQKYVYLSKYTHACIPPSAETTAQGKDSYSIYFLTFAGVRFS